MKIRVLCFLLGAVMAGAAAFAGSPAFAEQYVKPDEPGRFEIPQQGPGPAYTNRRWIGLMKKGLSQCPPADGWSADSLTSGFHFDPQLLQESGLDRFCVYTNVDPSKPLEPLPAGLVKAERDRMDLSAMATHVPSTGALNDASWRILTDRFLDQAGQAHLARTDVPHVRLVFIDSHPTGEWPLPPPLPDQPWHGYTMAHFAHRIACGGGNSCPIVIATRLALRYPAYAPDMPIPRPSAASESGGRLGLVSDLALAISNEVGRWESSQPKTKLVLNLSVGWDGELQGKGSIPDLKSRRKSKLEPSVLAVYDALRYAARRGVLVIAAAGNRQRPGTGGPVLPAAWELYRPSRMPFGLCRKPLYAMGGVDWQGLPLANSRPGGRPRRAAYGDHAIVETGEPAAAPGGPEESTLVYTGTSVSAAVASSIAAVLWDLRPELRRAGVMRLLERTADVLETRADFYAWRRFSAILGPPRVRRLSLCRSVLDACGPDGSRCAALESIACRLGRYAPADLSLISLPEVTTSFEPPSPPPPPCDSRTRLHRATARTIRPTPGVTARDLCPLELLSGLTAADWVGPQPEENPCPNCTVVPEPPRHVSLSLAEPAEPGYALLLEIDPQWQATTAAAINSAILTINCYADGGSPAERISLDVSDQLSSSPAKVFLHAIDGRESLAGCTASVDFKVSAIANGQERSVQSPVYVDP